MAYIKTLFKKFFNNIEEGEDNSQIYPVTVTSAVFDKNNNNLELLLQDINNKINDTQSIDNKINGIVSTLSVISGSEIINMEDLIAGSKSATMTVDRSKQQIKFTFEGVSDWGAFAWNYIHLQPCQIGIKGIFSIEGASTNGTKYIDFGTISWDEGGDITIPNEILGNGYPTQFLARCSGPIKIKPSQRLNITLTYQPKNN